jgi:hypothetical protein
MTATLSPAPAPAGERKAGPGSRLVLVLSLILALLAIGSGTATLVSLLWLRSQTTHTELAAASHLRVRQSCGAITVRAGGAGTIDLTSKVWKTFGGPRVTTRLSGDTLSVDVHCPAYTVGGISGSSSLTLLVPAGTALDVASDGGSVHLVGVSGTVVAHSSAGSVRGEGLKSASVRATSSAGGVHLDFAAPPSAVVAQSSAGSVSVSVPDDGTTYAVDAHSSAGSTHVGIATDPKSTRTIKATSSAGGVSIDWR